MRSGAGSADTRYYYNDRPERREHVLLKEVKTTAIQCSYQVLSYPLDYARTLIQLGYEPFAPVERTSIFYKSTYLALPNVFEYLRYIKNVDGFFGCYRGLSARLCQNIVANSVYRQVANKNPWGDEKTKRDQRNPPQQYQLSSTRSGAWIRDAFGDMDDDFVLALRKAGWEIVCVTASTVASHPFYVIAMRTMGQFVGRETSYKSLLQSISYIYENEGISGFFSGLFPRIIGDIAYIGISASLVYLASHYMGKPLMMDSGLAAMASNLVASSCTYQFHVVSSVMAVNNSGLTIGYYPYTLKFDGWLECWKDLKDKKQLKRGSAIIGRQFLGSIILVNGSKRPTGFYFGPIHPPGLGVRDELLQNIFLKAGPPKTD